MKKSSVLLLAVILLAIWGQTSCASHQSVGLKAADPEDVGLTWQECAISQGPDWNQAEACFSYPMSSCWIQAEACFGHPMPLWNESEKANFGSYLGDMESLQLTIGQDIYRVSLTAKLFMKAKYTLYKNGHAIRSLYGEFGAHSPNISLQNIGGKAAWEFSDGKIATIIYDRLDVRQVYGLDRAYGPYGLAGKLIFIGERNGKYFVVYDGWKVGPDFDKIAIVYCCDVALCSIHYGQGKYLFWGFRNGQWHAVEIALRGE
jgi:hypothetical protein